MATRKVRFTLHIPAHEYQQYYSGSASNVIVTATDGRNIQFPANILRSFVTHDGIHGDFVIEFDYNNKFVAINQI